MEKLNNLIQIDPFKHLKRACRGFLVVWICSVIVAVTAMADSYSPIDTLYILFGDEDRE